jgi:hypothetical protein
MFDRELKRSIAGSMERIDGSMERIDGSIERIDGSRVRIDGSMERIDAHMERGNQLMGEVREEMRLSREQHADLRQFIRDMTLRMHKDGEAHAKAIDANTTVLVELREDIIATRKGMFQVLDRLDPPPEPGAGAS